MQNYSKLLNTPSRMSYLQEQMLLYTAQDEFDVERKSEELDYC